MTADAQAADLPARPNRATLIVYLGVMIAMFMAVLDMQIIVTALPTIAGELGNLHLFGWVGASFLLSTAAVAPFYGKLGDMYGRKNVLIVAIVLFLAGSLACGIAWSMETLIAARVLQGLGGGGLMVSAFAAIGELFTARDRAKYQGYTSAVFALASVLGPVAGGTITDLFGWRWVFLVNLPVGVLVLAIIVAAMEGKSTGRSHRVDYAGGLLLALATTALVYWGDHVLSPAGPDIWTYALPVVGLAALAAFVAVERRAQEPIIPLRLLANRTISLTTLISLIMGMATLGQFFYFALYMQTITGLSPALVGMLFLPASVASMVSAMIAGNIIARTGRYKLFPVLAMAVGVVAMVSFTRVGAGTSPWIIGAMMAVFGTSMGLSMQVLMVAVQNAAPIEDIGAATSLVTQARTVGASLGLAVNGAVMVGALTAQEASMPAGLTTLLPDGLKELSPAGAAALPEQAAASVLSYYSAGFSTLFLFVAGLFAAALVLSILLEDVQIQKRA
jgi:EmrB/QacA subfamily drug resistance transporter